MDSSHQWNLASPAGGLVFSRKCIWLSWRLRAPSTQEAAEPHVVTLSRPQPVSYTQMSIGQSQA